MFQHNVLDNKWTLCIIILECSFIVPGTILAPIWWSWGHLGGSWGHLGEVLGALEVVLEPSWPQDGSKSQKMTKMDPKIPSILEGFWVHVGSKTHRKAIQNACKILIDFDIPFYWFFIDFGRVLGGFWEPCWPPRCIKNALPMLDRFD